MRRWLMVVLLLVIPAARVGGGVISDLPGWVVTGDEVGSEFGARVATAGDVNRDGYSDVIVGAPAYDNDLVDQGRVFVFHGSPTGLSGTADWSILFVQNLARLGSSVATAGDVNQDGYSDVVVGAENWTSEVGQEQEGRAFVFHGSPGGLESSASWTFEPDQGGAFAGASVATVGDVNGDSYSDVAVGAYLFTATGGGTGAVFVFAGSAGGLSANPAWQIEAQQFGERLGRSVAAAGDVNGDGYGDMIVGSDRFSNGENGEGRAAIWLGSASGLQAGLPFWQAEGNRELASYGQAVSTAGDVNGDGYADIIVGAPLFENGQGAEGLAVVFHGSSSGLVPARAYEGQQVGVLLGNSVSTAGDVNGDGFADVIIGVPYYSNGETYEGLVQVYLGSGGAGLSAFPDWQFESDLADATLGFSAGLAGDVNGDGFSDVIAGANGYGGLSPVGRVYGFHGSAEGLSLVEAWRAEANQANAQMGLAVASAGDVNGDGYSDVIVGAHFFDNLEEDEGAAFVYHGWPGGLSAQADWSVESNEWFAELGYSVAGAGDVNNDGYSDVIVGLYQYSNVETSEGAAQVYHGSSTGLESSPSWIGEGNQDAAFYGSRVSSAGDVNGDGFLDVVVGAFLWDDAFENEGAVFVYHGSASGLSPVHNWMAVGGQGFADYGYACSSAGDVNADGYSDLIVGAHLYNNDQIDEGRVFVYHGSAAGLSATANWTAESNQEADGANPPYYGISVSTAGDVNNDGFSDVIVGAQFYDNGSIDEGAVFVYHGGPGGLGSTVAWTSESNLTDSYFGCAVSTAGDVNGDGYSDVIIGAQRFYDLEFNEGWAFVHHGSPAGLVDTADWFAESNNANAQFGVSVSTAGDVDGDGYSDVLVGAWGYANTESSEGAAFLYYGNQGRGRTVLPTQRAFGLGRPVQLLGNSRQDDRVIVNMFEKAPSGRTQARLIREIKPVGTLFDHTNLHVSTLDDTGLTGTVSLVSTTGLTAGVPYHWRVRLQYLPHMNYTRWASIGPNGANETDFRTTGICTPTGEPETDCDMEDDDCDGLFNEDYVADGNCGVGLCNSTSTPSSCVSGTEILCVPGQPQEESQAAGTCNDVIDNDCDGMSDFSDDGCQSDCTDMDGDGYGEFGHPDCPNGTEIDCADNDSEINPGEDEVAHGCDALDNDCDTLTDEGVCDDGLYCTAVDYCSTEIGGCHHIPMNCDDGLACTTDSCDEMSDSCLHAEDVCDDDNACTLDTCQEPGGTCDHTTDPCDDGDPCTLDSCDPAAGCIHNAIDCSDDNACTDDLCDPASGDCIHSPTVCNDQDPCTRDSCDPAIGCTWPSLCRGCYVCADGTGKRCERISELPCDDMALCEVGTLDDPDDPDDGNFTECWSLDPNEGPCYTEGYCDVEMPGCRKPVVVYGTAEGQTLDCRLPPGTRTLALRVEVRGTVQAPAGFVPVRIVLENRWNKPLFRTRLKMSLGDTAAYVTGSAMLQGGVVPVSHGWEGTEVFLTLGNETRGIGARVVLDLLLVTNTLDNGKTFEMSMWAPCDAGDDEIGCHSPEDGLQQISEKVKALMKEGVYLDDSPGEDSGSPAPGCQCGREDGLPGVSLLLLAFMMISVVRRHR